MIEEGAGGVEQAADQQPQQGDARNRRQHRRHRDHHQPAHHQVDRRRQALEATGEEQLEHHAGQRQRPDRSEQSPAPRPTQADQGKRRVGAGNQQVDRAVVKHLEPRLGLGMRDGVIQRRSDVEQQQGHREDDGAAQLPAVSPQRGQRDQHRASTQTHHGAQAMGQSTGDFLAQAVAGAGQCRLRNGVAGWHVDTLDRAASRGKRSIE